MTVKLFIGTSIAPDLAEQVSALAHLQARAGSWRWSPRNQWHVTTLFIGFREEADVHDITGAVQRVCGLQKNFTLHNGQLVAMPEERPSMLWVRFDPSEELRGLHHTLATAISTLPSQYDPLWPHITLARGKGPMPVSCSSLIVPTLTIGELSLFRSDPGTDGTIHTALGTWPLL